MEVPKINFYIWTPRDQRNDGTLSITGTAKACDALIRAIEGGEGSHDFELAVPTGEDVEHIGSGVTHSFNWLRVTQDDTLRSDPELRIDRSADRVEFVVSGGASFLILFEVLETITDGSGDMSFTCLMDDKKVDVWYWPCFGHITPTRSPANLYPE